MNGLLILQQWWSSESRASVQFTGSNVSTQFLTSACLSVETGPPIHKHGATRSTLITVYLTTQQPSHGTKTSVAWCTMMRQYFTARRTQDADKTRSNTTMKQATKSSIIINDYMKSRNSSLGIPTRLRAGNFSLYHRAQNGSGSHPASYPMGTGALSLGLKRPGREADHSPPSSAEVKE
jgi:hypothetical protein